MSYTQTARAVLTVRRLSSRSSSRNVGFLRGENPSDRLPRRFSRWKPGCAADRSGVDHIGRRAQTFLEGEAIKEALRRKWRRI